MDTSDLRRGNYVDWGGPKKVLSIASDTVLLEHPENTDGCKPVHIHNIKGVALTPELLGRCEFIKSSASHFVGFAGDLIHAYVSRWVDGQGIRILEDREGSFLFFVQERSNPTRVEHLHQLQNLFFALTGTELQYTP